MLASGGPTDTLHSTHHHTLQIEEMVVTLINMGRKDASRIDVGPTRLFNMENIEFGVEKNWATSPMPTLSIIGRFRKIGFK